MLTRRTLLKRTAVLSGLALGLPAVGGFTKTSPKLRIGACDWSIGKSSDIGAFALAKEIGLDGIQVSLGSEANNMHMREADRQRAYVAESKKTGVQIASLAIGELNRVPYKSDPRTEEWVWDSVDVARSLGVKVVLLAFFWKNDLRDDDQGKQEVVRRLRKVAPKAEKNGVIFGIESYLSAEEHMDIIEQVGSPAIKVYYDFRNSADAGYDVIREIKWLGKENICELHMKENGFLLGEGTLDWPRIADTLHEMEYHGSGWMQIEGARPKEAEILPSYQRNLGYLKKQFQL